MKLAPIIQKEYMKDPCIQEGDVLDCRLVYVPENDLFYALNLSATLVWMLIEDRGGFSTSAKTESLRNYSDWFEPKPDRQTIEKDIELILKDFIDNKLLIKKPQSLNMHYRSCTIHANKSKGPYSPPKITTYDSQWMENNHPQYFHTITYSDLWSPSEK